MLQDPSLAGPGRPRLIETHISWVILAGDFAYKIKKPVNLGFLDFSTLEARRRACLEELRLNARLTPELYLDLVTIHDDADGPTLSGTGPVIEFAVKMRRFPAGAVIGEGMAQHAPTAREIAALGALVAEFHQALAPAAEKEAWGRIEQIRSPVTESLAQLRQPAFNVSPALLDEAEAFLLRELRRRADLMEQRRLAGRVRECHGDLHLANLVRIGDRIVPFDALEFDPALRWIDVLSEVAFLVMDLDIHGYRDLAFKFLNRYLDVTGDHQGLPVLPFYLSYRALVRAKVRALSPGRMSDEARATIAALLSYAAAPIHGLRPLMVLMCGISGSGKSWLAERLMTTLPAIRLRSDVERKRLFGLHALERTDSGLGEGIYVPEASRRTYERLAELSSAVIDAGLPVIIDATNLRRQHRESFIGAARSASCPVAILVCSAIPATIAARVQKRLASGLDPSEAGPAIVERQRLEFEPPQAAEADLVVTCDTSEEIDVDDLVERLRHL